MRGLIMVLLALESAGLYEQLSRATEDNWLHGFIRQFFHHPWHGLHIWDLVQPAFMFMAGTAMALSLDKQQRRGMTWNQSFRKTLKRCGWLFFWGVLSYAVRRRGLSFELWNVLTQLSFTTLVAFLIFRWSATAQIAVCVGLLLLTEIIYRFTNIPGFNQPFTDQHNFGNYVDLLLMNKINSDGWVAINCIPTAVHTIAGALAGKLLLADQARRNASTQQPAPHPNSQSIASSSSELPSPHSSATPLSSPTSGASDSAHAIRALFAWGLVSLAIGYTLDWTGVTPIIKRIATSSFTLVSLGWVLWILALCYSWIDIKDHRRRLQFFTVIGMNSLFIYLFFGIVGDHWFNGYIQAITNGLTGPLQFSAIWQGITAAICIFGLEWGLCYFLYKKKIFFRL
jgi:predicted acyltransferase